MGFGISAIILVYNEEETITRALDSLTGIADQVVVIDTGSVDKTTDLVRTHSLCPEVYKKNWQDDFSAIRNYAISLCRYPCCLVLDADEYISDESKPEVRHLLTNAINKDPYALFAPVIDNLNGTLLKNNPRIFVKRDNLFYKGRVHEYLTSTSPVKVISVDGIIIKHTGYLEDVYEKRNKRIRNKKLLTKQLSEEPDNLRWKYFMLRYLDHSTEKALSLLNDFGRLSLPYPDDIEVYAFNAKTRLIQCLLETNDNQTALLHASELYEYYKDYDTSLLYIYATYHSAYQYLRQQVAHCNNLFRDINCLCRDEYLHERFPENLLKSLSYNLAVLSDTMNIIDEK